MFAARPLFFHFLLASLVAILVTSAYAVADDRYNDDELPPVTILKANDFEALGNTADRDNKLILLEMSSSICSYCERLEEEIIKPMLRSGDYVNTVLIRKLNIDSQQTMKNFDGAAISPADFASHYRISVTPTLLILDGNGNEISKRIVGIYSLDFFASYVDEALIKGRQRLHCQKAQDCTQ
jgi:thioredoxin-related protein